MDSTQLSSVDITWSGPDTLIFDRLLPASLKPYGANIELLFTSAAFLSYVPHVWTFLRGFPTSKKGKVIGFTPPEMLVFHIVVSMVMVVRHLWRLGTETAPTTTAVDLVLGLSQAFSSWYLIRNTPYKSILWKSSFQTMTPMFAFAVVRAYQIGSPSWYTTSTAFLFWFVTIRWAKLASMQLKFYPEVSTPVFMNLGSVPLTLIWGNWSSAVPFWLVAVGLLTHFNKWVTKKVPHSQAPRSLTLSVLTLLGFGEYCTAKPPIAQQKTE